MAQPNGRTRLIFSRGSWPEISRTGQILREESVGGALLLVATVLALVWANSPAADSYTTLRDTHFGPEFLHLNLSAGEWAADGLLAIFFFVAGLELKREFVAGDLRDPRRATLPVAAAIGGMVLPAAFFLMLTASGQAGDTKGWAIPTATDIAFAVAVLMVISTHLPASLRTFLLTLAVVDDLLAIIIIATLFTSDLDLLMLGLAVVPLAAFGFLAQRRISHPLLLLPLAMTVWSLVHASGVHATVAGVLLAFTVPVQRLDGDGSVIPGVGLAEHLEHRIRPLSAGVAVPVFAFLSAGVAFGGFAGLGTALTDRVALGIILGLVLGKPIGITLASWLVARFTHAQLDPTLSWLDVIGVSILGGIGFTVSLLIGDLAFDGTPSRVEVVKVGVLVGSLSSAVLASVVLRSRNRVYKRLWEEEERGLADLGQANGEITSAN